MLDNNINNDNNNADNGDDGNVVIILAYGNSLAR